MKIKTGVFILFVFHYLGTSLFALESGIYLISCMQRSRDGTTAACPGYLLSIGKNNKIEVARPQGVSEITVESLVLENGGQPGEFVMKVKYKMKHVPRDKRDSSQEWFSIHNLFLEYSKKVATGVVAEVGEGAQYIEASIDKLAIVIN